MSAKKTTPESLYLKDLKKSSKYKSFDNASASTLFKKLNLKEKELYIIMSRKINERISAQNAGTYTTQRDTIGTNLKEVSECSNRVSRWEESVCEIIKKIVDYDNVIERQFVMVHINGVYFTRPNESEDIYVAGEINFVKFNFKSGIIKSLVLFPDSLRVSLGYRESLYEALEESVGWRPNTFTNNNTLDDCSKQIREFFYGGYDPIFVQNKLQMQAVGVFLFNMYSELGQRCPWLHSVSDWGQHCLIYRLDDLIANILNKKNPIDKPNEAISSSDVCEHWTKMNSVIATECCERHQDHGLPNQCPNDIIRKTLYSSFLLMQPIYKDEMSSISELVSEDYFKNLDLVLEPEPLPSTTCTGHHEHKPILGRNQWHGYSLDHLANVEDIISGLQALSLRGARRDTDGVAVAKQQVVMLGRGRGASKPQDKCQRPGQVDNTIRKIKLPSVVC